MMGMPYLLMAGFGVWMYRAVKLARKSELNHQEHEGHEDEFGAAEGESETRDR